MNGPNATLYYRYGAHELKARYQAHLVLGQIFVLILIGLGFAISSLLPRADLVTIVPIPPRDAARVHIGPPPSIDRTLPKPGGGAKPPTDRIGIPIPVEDSSAISDVIPTQEELSQRLDAISPSGAGDSAFTIDTSGKNFFPDTGVFVPCDSLPVMIRESKPIYPDQAVKTGLEGRVFINALIDQEGTVRKVIVAKSSGVECLDRSAANAAWHCLYRPAIQNGHPIAVWVTYPVVFRLQ